MVNFVLCCLNFVCIKNSVRGISIKIQWNIPSKVGEVMEDASQRKPWLVGIYDRKSNCPNCVCKVNFNERNIFICLKTENFINSILE